MSSLSVRIELIICLSIQDINYDYAYQDSIRLLDKLTELIELVHFIELKHERQSVMKVALETHAEFYFDIHFLS